MKSSPFPETRDSLLNELRTGGADSGWRLFFERYAPAIYHVARFRKLPQHDAEDIVQQVMLEVSKEIADFEYAPDRGRFRNWIRTIAERKIIDLFRKRRPEFVESYEQCEQLPDERSLEDAWTTEWRLMDIEHCMEQLAQEVSPRHMQVFRMYSLEGIPAKEVSQRLGVPVGYVYVIRGRILRLLRERIEALETREGESKHG